MSKEQENTKDHAFIADVMRRVFKEIKVDEECIVERTNHTEEFKKGFREAIRILAIIIKEETEVDVRDSA